MKNFIQNDNKIEVWLLSVARETKQLGSGFCQVHSAVSNVKSQADWALSLLTTTTELWLPKLGIRRYHHSKPEFWTSPELSDTRVVISVNLSFGDTASLWIQGGLGHPSPSPVKMRISRSSQRRNRIRKKAFFSREKVFSSPSAPSLAILDSSSSEA